MSAAEDLRVLIVADNASEEYGGEAALPLHYFKGLLARGIPTWLITHSRVRHELSARMPQDLDRIYFIEDSRLHRMLWSLGHVLSRRVRQASLDFLSRLITQRAQRQLAKALVRQHSINVVHQPTPVSPREPSLIKDVGAPVVFGPMNGATDYPAAFRDREWRITRGIVALMRGLAPALGRLITGKRDAAILPVANERSRAALVEAQDGKVFGLPENGVDLKLWSRRGHAERTGSTCRFVFVGRLIRSKGVDLWLEAFDRALSGGVPITGLVIGDGPERAALMQQARSRAILAGSANQPGLVFFAGWKDQADLIPLLADQDCLVLPTLCECGGAVILEAMAMELPVIATNWGGPADYVDSSCGILVAPDQPETFIAGLAQAMTRLASDPDLRARMGSAGRRKVEALYSWESKIESILGFYRRAVRSDHFSEADGAA